MDLRTPESEAASRDERAHGNRLLRRNRTRDRMTEYPGERDDGRGAHHQITLRLNCSRSRSLS